MGPSRISPGPTTSTWRHIPWSRNSAKIPQALHPAGSSSGGKLADYFGLPRQRSPLRSVSFARGYSATAAGVAYVPFTLVVGLLSRWSGRQGDKFGARWPLICGPALAAVGFALLGSGKGSYWVTLASMTVLGFGMGITVAPLTTTVINAVPQDRTGVASGINNAVASVGSLLLIAVLGSVALGVFEHSLTRDLGTVHASPAVRATVDSARGGFVVPPMAASLSAKERQQARAIVTGALTTTVRMAMWIAALLAVAGALTAVITIRPDERRRKARYQQWDSA